MNRGYQHYSDGRSGMGQVHILPYRAATVIGGALLAGLSDAVGLVLTWLDRYRERRMLESLSDYMLKDIGVSRADIDQEVRKKFWRP